MFCLETPRLLLRDFLIEDWQALLAYQQEPDYLRYYPWVSRTESDVRNFVRLFRDWQEARPRYRYQLAIVLADSKEVIGNAGVRCPKEGSNLAELGYELAPAHWGNGYATEAAAALVSFAFEELKLQRLQANCNAENAASARVLSKLGFRMEWHEPGAVYFKGRWWDMLHYSLDRPGIG